MCSRGPKPRSWCKTEIITTAARRVDGRAAAWFLEHRRPDQWSNLAKWRQNGPDEELRIKAKEWDDYVEHSHEEQKEFQELAQADPVLYDAVFTYLEALGNARKKSQHDRRATARTTGELRFKSATMNRRS